MSGFFRYMCFVDTFIYEEYSENKKYEMRMCMTGQKIKKVLISITDYLYTVYEVFLIVVIIMGTLLGDELGLFLKNLKNMQMVLSSLCDIAILMAVPVLITAITAFYDKKKFMKRSIIMIITFLFLFFVFITEMM